MDSEGAGARPGAAQVVGVVVEQQLTVGNHTFQDTDGLHDRGDGHPGSITQLTLRSVVAVRVPGGLVHSARDQVAPLRLCTVRLRVGAAAAAQSGHFTGAHPGQVGDDDEARCAQLAHQEGCFGVVDSLSPHGLAEQSGERDAERAGAGPTQGGLSPSSITAGVVDLVERGAGERGDVGARRCGSAQPIRASSRGKRRRRRPCGARAVRDHLGQGVPAGQPPGEVPGTVSSAGAMTTAPRSGSPSCRWLWPPLPWNGFWSSRTATWGRRRPTSKAADGPLDALRVRTRPQDCTPGATFPADRIGADVDLAADGMLLDFKSTRYTRTLRQAEASTPSLH